jgi:hypothetical protein
MILFDHTNFPFKEDKHITYLYPLGEIISLTGICITTSNTIRFANSLRWAYEYNNLNHLPFEVYQI